MNRTTLLAALGSALLGIGFSLILSDDFFWNGLILVVIGSLFWYLTYRSIQAEEQWAREGREEEYSLTVDDLMDFLGDEWAERNKGTPWDGEEEVRKRISDVPFPTDKELWRGTGLSDSRTLNGFLYDLDRKARGEKRRRLTRIRKVLARNYRDWSRTIDRSEKPKRFLSWLGGIRTTQQDIFHLWAYLECARIESRNQFGGKHLVPDFKDYKALQDLWGRPRPPE